MSQNKPLTPVKFLISVQTCQIQEFLIIFPILLINMMQTSVAPDVYQDLCYLTAACYFHLYQQGLMIGSNLNEALTG